MEQNVGSELAVVVWVIGSCFCFGESILFDLMEQESALQVNGIRHSRDLNKKIIWKVIFLD